MTERERPLNPEKIYGKEFRVPAIVGLGSGSGFKLEGLNLPINWEKAIPRLKESSPEGLQRLFEWDCGSMKLVPGKLTVDSNTNVLTEIIIPQSDPQRPARLYLEDSVFPRGEQGMYVSENVDDIRAAVVLQSTACRFLNWVDPEAGYAYIERAGGGYHSVGLKVPEKILQMKGPISNEFSQRRFEIEASNIAGRFGFDPMILNFNQKGLLTGVSMREGGGRWYSFDPGFKNYYPHNIDNVWQAAALHGVCAAFMNSQLERKD